jgi:hypothetical protein
VIKKVHINMCTILDGCGITGIFQLLYTPLCEPRRSQLAGDLGGLSPSQLSRQPNYNSTLAYSRSSQLSGMLFSAGGGIFENEI